MRFKFLIISLLCTLIACAQVRDIAKLANGELIYSSIIYDADSQVFGYLYLYEQNIEKNTRTVEFVFLDKNLNAVNNGKFTEPFIQTNNSFKMGFSGQIIDCDYVDGKIVLIKKYYNHNYGYTSWTSKVLSMQVISLSDNSVSKDMICKDNKLVPIPGSVDSILAPKYVGSLNNILSVCNKYHSGFLIRDQKEIKCFNTKLEYQWTHKNDTMPAKSKESVNYEMVYVKKNIFLKKTMYKNSFYQTDSLICINFENGLTKWINELNTKTALNSNELNIRESDDKVYLMGNFSKNTKSETFDEMNTLGMYIKVLNDTGAVMQDKYYNWTDFDTKYGIRKDGTLEKNFHVLTKRYFLFKDGRITALTETYRPRYTSLLLHMLFPVGTIINLFTSRFYETHGDIMLFNFNPDLSLKDIDVIAKEKSKDYSSVTSDFLFSNYTNDGNGATFFYLNATKEKDAKKSTIMMGIDRLKNNERVEERIPVYSENKYSIVPLPAKEGYVLFKEYNEKAKYNQVRLERLNN